MSGTAERVKATFAGSVAALWLHHCHTLVTLLEDNGGLAFDKADQWFRIADRLEENLKHLEFSSMPIPGMNLEDVIQLGADIAAGEETEAATRRDLKEDDAISLYADSKIEATERIAAERDILLCVDCGAPPGGPTHKEICGGGRAEPRVAEPQKYAGSPKWEEDIRGVMAEAEKLEAASPQLGNNGSQLDKPTAILGEKTPVSKRGGAHKCPRCGAYFTSNIHRQCKAQTSPTPKDNKCPVCTFTLNSQTHRERCAEAAEEQRALQEKARVKALVPVSANAGIPTVCPKCLGKLFHDDDDRVCLCGYRYTPATLTQEEAIAERAAARRPASTGGVDL